MMSRIREPLHIYHALYVFYFKAFRPLGNVTSCGTGVVSAENTINNSEQPVKFYCLKFISEVTGMWRLIETAAATIISYHSKSCYSHIHELCCIRPYLDSKTASTLLPLLYMLHYKLDYCNSLLWLCIDLSLLY